jgi:hypothetical protein
MAFPDEITKIERERQTLAQNLQKETEKPIKIYTDMTTDNTLMSRDIVNMIIEDAKVGYPNYNSDQLHEVLKVSLGSAFNCFINSAIYYRHADIIDTFKKLDYYPSNKNVAELLDEIILAEIDVFTLSLDDEYNKVVKTITDMSIDFFAEMYNLTEDEKNKFHDFIWDYDHLCLDWAILNAKNFNADNKSYLNEEFEECFGYAHDAECRFNTKVAFPSTNLRKSKQIVCGSIADTMSMTFAILNTKNYDDGDNMGYTIVQGISPELLYNYGFDTEEVEEAGKLPIGGTMESYLYGDGAIVVRMS